MTAGPIQETSAGGVLIRHTPQRFEVCVILRGRHRRHAWSLPKGHVELHEPVQAAALREVLEETGWTAEVLSALGTIQYRFMTPEERAPRLKRVTFFLMRAIQQQGPHDPEEVIETRWVSLDEALTQVAYENEREMLRRAKVVIETEEIKGRFGL